MICFTQAPEDDISIDKIKISDSTHDYKWDDEKFEESSVDSIPEDIPEDPIEEVHESSSEEELPEVSNPEELFTGFITRLAAVIKDEGLTPR